MSAISQGFLEMPDTSEVPEYERESMLLDLDVPPVRDRDPDPEAGPRLNIKEFKLQGLVEFPELGITRKGLIERVEGIRFELMKEGELTDSGYTLDELGEVSDLIADIEKGTSEEHVGALEVQKLVFLIREQRRKRGVTLGMIETVADTITRYYRERGFVLAKAYIPEQKVRDGVVTLTLLLGELGQVTVENRRRVSEGLVTRVFKKDLNAPVTSWNVEESIYLVNDIPGVNSQGFFSPGSQVGDTKLTVNLLEEDWYSGNIRLDNHGSEDSSQNRAYMDIYIHNPLGYGDEVYLALLKSYDPNESTYGAFRYSSLIGSPRVRTQIGVSTNDFVSRSVVNGDNVVTGESRVGDVGFSYIFKRSRVKNISLDLSYMDVDTTIDSGNGIDSNQNMQKTSLVFNFDILNEKKRQLYVGDISLAGSTTFTTQGVLSGDGDSEGSHVLFNYNFTMLSFFKFPFTDYENRLVFKTSGQYAGEGVSNLNQKSLTGPETVRAFGVTGFQADDAIYAGVDWIFGFPSFGGAKFFGQNISKVVQPYLFFDYAIGNQYPGIEASESDLGRLAAMGLGVSFNHSNFSLGIVGAIPLEDHVAGNDDSTPESDVYLDFQYSF
ncbi:MAG: ShlB/FhaC/HecB family hemolysin secretion/activation protein [Agarilytica sp.]